MDVRTAQKIVDLFYPLVELTILEADGSVEAILNPFSSLKEDQVCRFSDCPDDKPFYELLAGGRSVRSLVYPIPARPGKIATGFLRLRYDLTLFKNLQEQLNFLVQPAISTEGTIDRWNDSIDRVISDYLADKKVTTQSATQNQKREIISEVQRKGLLDFKESSAYLAGKLQVSRATVYNYLKTAASLRKVDIHQVDAFTSKQFGGNPAGVVLDADTLDEATMRKIARELNLSETSFVLPSRAAAFRLRYFTPTGHEVGFCGHSTVGALYMIAKEERFGIGRLGTYTFDVETQCGILPMEAEIDEEGEIRVGYETPPVRLRKANLSHREVAHAAGFDVKCIDASYPVMYEETNQDLYVFIPSLEHLKEIECNQKSLAQFSKQHQVVALCLFTAETFDKRHQFHMRCFAPSVGIAEDPFTGSVLGGLTAYVDQFKLLPKRSTCFDVEQGHFIGRPGAVKVQYSKKKGAYQVHVSAQAVHCFSTEINLG